MGELFNGALTRLSGGKSPVSTHRRPVKTCETDRDQTVTYAEKSSEGPLRVLVGDYAQVGIQV